MVCVFGCQQGVILPIKPDAIEVAEIRIASLFTSVGEKVKPSILFIDS